MLLRYKSSHTGISLLKPLLATLILLIASLVAIFYLRSPVSAADPAQHEGYNASARQGKMAGYSGVAPAMSMAEMDAMMDEMMATMTMSGTMSGDMTSDMMSDMTMAQMGQMMQMMGMMHQQMGQMQMMMGASMMGEGMSTSSMGHMMSMMHQQMAMMHMMAGHMAGDMMGSGMMGSSMDGMNATPEVTATAELEATAEPEASTEATAEAKADTPAAPSEHPDHPLVIESHNASTGAVTVEVIPLAEDELLEVAFAVTLETHSVNLDLDLAEQATLTIGESEFAPTRWEPDTADGHHVSGTLIFTIDHPAHVALDSVQEVTLNLGEIDGQVVTLTFAVAN